MRCRCYFLSALGRSCLFLSFLALLSSHFDLPVLLDERLSMTSWNETPSMFQRWKRKGKESKKQAIWNERFESLSRWVAAALPGAPAAGRAKAARPSTEASGAFREWIVSKQTEDFSFDQMLQTSRKNASVDPKRCDSMAFEVWASKGWRRWLVDGGGGTAENAKRPMASTHPVALPTCR